MNPIRAGMVKRPEQYLWSSYNVNALGDTGWLTPQNGDLRLGQTIQKRADACHEPFRHPISDGGLHLIRKAAHYCQWAGGDRFRDQIEKKYGIKLGQISA